MVPWLLVTLIRHGFNRVQARDHPRQGRFHTEAALLRWWGNARQNGSTSVTTQRAHKAIDQTELRKERKPLDGAGVRPRFREIRGMLKGATPVERKMIVGGLVRMVGSETTEAVGSGVQLPARTA